MATGQDSSMLIIAGESAHTNHLSKVWKLNEATGKCEEVMTHTFRHNSAVCETSLGVLVAGGGTEPNEASTVMDCDLLHLKTMKWRKMPDTLTKMYGSGAVNVHDQVFMVGGWFGREETMECFDLIDRRWSACKDMLDKMRHPIVCAVGQIIYVLMNTSPVNKIFRKSTGITLQCYNVSSEQWSYGPDLPDSFKETWGASIASLNHRFYVVGGWQRLCLCYDTIQKSWTTLQGPSQMHHYGSSVFCGHKLILCSGIDSCVKQDSIESFDVKREEWKVSQCKLPVPMWFPFCCIME